MPGSEMAGSAGSPLAFSNSMATMQLPAMGYGLRYEYGMFRQSIEDGWQREHPDNWLRRQRPVGSRSPERERWNSSSVPRFKMHGR